MQLARNITNSCIAEPWSTSQLAITWMIVTLKRRFGVRLRYNENSIHCMVTLGFAFNHSCYLKRGLHVSSI